jgi:hypothetical protein
MNDEHAKWDALFEMVVGVPGMLEQKQTKHFPHCVYRQLDPGSDEPLRGRDCSSFS